MEAEHITVTDALGSVVVGNGKMGRMDWKV